MTRAELAIRSLRCFYTRINGVRYRLRLGNLGAIYVETEVGEDQWVVRETISSPTLSYIIGARVRLGKD